MSDSPELARMVRDRAIAEAKAERTARERAVVAMFASAAAERNRPYARPGDEPWRLMTAEQWSIYDSMNASWDRMEAKYGRFAPSMFSATMRATARRIW